MATVENTTTWCFPTRPDMNKWLKGIYLRLNKYGFVMTYDGTVSGIWVKAGSEFYVTIFHREDK